MLVFSSGPSLSANFPMVVKNFPMVVKFLVFSCVKVEFCFCVSPPKLLIVLKNVLVVRFVFITKNVR